MCLLMKKKICYSSILYIYTYIVYFNFWNNSKEDFKAKFLTLLVFWVGNNKCNLRLVFFLHLNLIKLKIEWIKGDKGMIMGHDWSIYFFSLHSKYSLNKSVVPRIKGLTGFHLCKNVKGQNQFFSNLTFSYINPQLLYRDSDKGI